MDYLFMLRDAQMPRLISFCIDHNLVECSINKLRYFRAVATQYDPMDDKASV
jgi:hypothetical protein